MIPERTHNFGTYFVTAQTWERRSLFHVDELAQLLIEILYKYRRQNRYLVHEFVIMPDHLHVILTPVQITIERAMQFIKGGYSHVVGETGRKNLEIWQRGFTDHRIRDSEDYAQHREYVHLNPVRAKLCENAADFLYSSAHRGFELDEVPQRLKPLVSAATVRHG